MSLKDVKIKSKYRTPDNIPKDFYIPVLSQTKLYYRAVGFFSSSVLVEIAEGISSLARNNGKIRIITSPKLSDEDIESINAGYKKRYEVVEEALLREFQEHPKEFDKERLNMLAHLIGDGVLDIKIAFTTHHGGIGTYHEKLGIMEDDEGNFISFYGSANETQQALKLNHESIHVYSSWNEFERASGEKQTFERMWNNLDRGLEIIDFPDVIKNKLEAYKKEAYNKFLDADLKDESGDIIEFIRKQPNVPMIPDDVELHDYQNIAIEQWRKQNFQGIFDMATGTGKTYTGLGALVDLYDFCNGDLAVIICCPFIHLVEQWVEDIRKFNIEPIIGYGNSPQKQWKERLSEAVNLFNRKGISNKFFCFICTNATFTSSFVQKQINELSNNALFMIDEAHYFGSTSLSKLMPKHFSYRLALSATLERHGDSVGTGMLYNYFHDKCIEYTIEQAINEKKLTKYYYYPHPVYLYSDEMEEYKKLTFEIKKYINPNNLDNIPEIAKMLLIKRSRILASARNKLEVLRGLMSDYKNDYNILVYCGDSVVADPNANEFKESKVFGEKQISLVCQMLGNDFDMDVAKFTASESIERRLEIKKGFSNQSEYQVIVAIKCLDEGFNIPSIRTAFILASTTNPKQYIQRRGRVLRLHGDKDYAYIHDFVVLPRDINSILNAPEEDIHIEKGLVKRELNRVEEFAKLAENSSEVYNSLIWQLYDAYKFNEDKFIDEIYENIQEG